MAKWGYVGHFSTVDLLPPAEKCAGNQATVGSSGDMAIYFSDGADWAEVGTGAGGGSDDILGLVDGEDVTDIFQAAIDEAADNGKVRKRISTQGEYRVDRIDMPPAISLVNDARGGVFINAADNMDALTPEGSDNSILRVLALTPAFGGTRSWTSVYSGFNIDGRKGNQVNEITSIRMCNPNPSENTHDPDPNFTTNKDYAATRLANIEVNGSSGIGIDIEAGRGRAYLHDVRAINGNSNGIKISSNDSIIGHRCATGGNNLTGIIAGSGSGCLMDGVNMWGKYAGYRNTGCIAFKSNNTKGGVMNMCVLNDSAWWNATTNAWRGWVVSNNLIEPHEEAFYADGFAYDIDNTAGNEDPITQAAFSVTGYTNFVVGANLWSRTPKTTRFNTNGNPDGLDGTAYQHLIRAEDGAHVNCELPVSVIARDRPWYSADPAGISTQGAGTIVNYRQHAIGDDYGLHRFGTRGSGTTSHFMACADETADYDPNYAVWLGEASRRNQILGYTEFSAGPLLNSTAIDGRPATNGGSRNISDKVAVQRLSISGTIATYTVNLPYIHNGSKRLLVFFVSGNITALTWQTTRSDDVTLDVIPSANDTANDNTAAYFPTTTQGLTAVELYWGESTHEWYVVSVYQRGEPWVILTDSATISTNADAGNNFKVTLGGNRTLSNPNNMVDGQALAWQIIQDATGSRALSYGSKFTFLGTTETPRTTPTANAVDVLLGVYDATSDKIYCQLIKQQAAAWVALTDAGTIATECDLGTCFYVTLGGNRTLGNPTHMVDGQRYRWRITQDGTGSRTLAYGGKFRFPGGAPTATTTAGAIDYIEGVYDAVADKIDCVMTKAYA